MHWKIKHTGKAGDIRTITKFTLIPRICENGHRHWLETVTINQFWGSYTKTWRDLDAEFEIDPSTIFKCNCNIAK